MAMRDVVAGALAAAWICAIGPFYQNVRLMEALAKKGYEVNYAWGMNRHGQAMGGAILPEMMRWLWRDHPVSTDPRDTTERSMAGPPAPASGSGGTRPTVPAKN